MQDPVVTRIIELAHAAGYDTALLVAQAWQESRFNPNAVSPTGAAGLFQFMPATAAEYGVDVHDVESSTRGAMKYMGALLKRFGGSKEKALAAYDWGEGNVARLLHEHPEDWKLFLPGETRDYLKILNLAALLEKVI